MRRAGKDEGGGDRGVDLATGHGENIWDLNPELATKSRGLYEDAKGSSGQS